MNTTKTPAPDFAKIVKALHAVTGSPTSRLDRLHRTESYIEATDGYKLVRVFGTFDDSPEYAQEYPNTDAIISTENPKISLLVDLELLADTTKALLAIHKAQKNKKKALAWIDIPTNHTAKPLCFKTLDGVALALLMPVRQ